MTSVVLVTNVIFALLILFFLRIEKNRKLQLFFGENSIFN